MVRTIVCGASVPVAHHWCQHNGVLPRARTTYILTPRDTSGGRGFRLTLEDRVVFVGEADWRPLQAVLAPAGLGSVVSPEFAR